VNINQAAADAAAFEQAYRLGYEAGIAVGRRQLDHELTEADQRRTAYMHGLASTPRYAEIEARRWNGPRAQFGQPCPGDYPGGPVTWDTGRGRQEGAAA
jgi:hypothetical protein